MGSRLYRKDRSRKPSEPLKNRFGGAIYELLGALKKTDGFRHAQTKGVSREVPVRNLLSDNLPKCYDVVGGEIVDVHGNTSPQMDVIVYNGHRNPVLLAGDAHIVPAEAPLITMEVKTLLNATELTKSVKAAQKLKSLKPMGKDLRSSRHDGKTSDGAFRYMHCLFGYNTDLVEGDDWAEREYKRYCDTVTACGAEMDSIDRIYIADRGLIMTDKGVGLTETAAEGAALLKLFLHSLNFCIREDERRPHVDFENYAGVSSKGWRSLKKKQS